jgi:hypothetical protein
MMSQTGQSKGSAKDRKRTDFFAPHMARRPTGIFQVLTSDQMATKERLAAMAASLCAVCSGSMVATLVEADPSDGASELRTYVCAECGHTRTYSVTAGSS